MSEVIKSSGAPSPDYFNELISDEESLPDLQSDFEMISPENLAIGMKVQRIHNDHLSSWQVDIL
jgi:hypothetical protein